MTPAPFLRAAIRALVGGLLLLGAWTASADVLLPQAPPGTPVLREGAAPCTPTMGVHKRVYDTDPGGKGAIVEFRLFDPTTTPPEGPVFLVIIQEKTGEAKAYLALPGRGVLALTMETLMARYAAPCEIVQQIVGSPS